MNWFKLNLFLAVFILELYDSTRIGAFKQIIECLLFFATDFKSDGLIQPMNIIKNRPLAVKFDENCQQY